MEEDSQSLYEAIGGEAAVRRLVDAFYRIVQEDPEIGKLFPEEIGPVREKQFLFLTQFFGGPPLFSGQYGHPMMRARHMPVEITPKRADVWLDCMRKALSEIGMEPMLREVVLERLKAPAYHFVNAAEKAD